ncbi:hypothetical protein ACFWRV_19880 [Streptomyces sp. NPDC058576]|uniref:hypothetical protein n=1 Tax=Streptomyces sp. NPDC058576 TaxID=3346547 RepID=UPI003646A4BB
MGPADFKGDDDPFTHVLACGSRDGSTTSGGDGAAGSGGAGGKGREAGGGLPRTSPTKGRTSYEGESGKKGGDAHIVIAW